MLNLEHWGEFLYSLKLLLVNLVKFCLFQHLELSPYNLTQLGHAYRTRSTSTNQQSQLTGFYTGGAFVLNGIINWWSGS